MDCYTERVAPLWKLFVDTVQAIKLKSKIICLTVVSIIPRLERAHELQYGKVVKMG